MENRQKKSIVLYIITIIIAMSVFIFIQIRIGSIQEQDTLLVTQLSAQSHSQMMGYVVQTQKGKTIVIDGGTKEDASNLENYVLQYGGKVDAWFLTHPHQDHVGAFTKIFSEEEPKITVENIYCSVNSLSWYEQYDSTRKEEIEEFLTVLETMKGKVKQPNLHEVITIDNVTCKILGIKNPEITNNAGNNSSMVIQMQVADKKILFLGDTGEESSAKLIQNNSVEDLQCQIVQMAHHGQSGATKELYTIIQPKVCLWPTTQWLWNNDAGTGEDSGPWKTKETRAWMQELGVKQHIIAKDGDVTIQI